MRLHEVQGPLFYIPSPPAAGHPPRQGSGFVSHWLSDGGYCRGMTPSSCDISLGSGPPVWHLLPAQQGPGRQVLCPSFPLDRLSSVDYFVYQTPVHPTLPNPLHPPPAALMSAARPSPVPASTAKKDLETRMPIGWLPTTNAPKSF